MLQVVEVELNNTINDMSLRWSCRDDFCLPVAADELSKTVKSECDGLNNQQTAMSPSVTSSSISSLAQSMSAEVCSAVSVKQEHLSPEYEQTELMTSSETCCQSAACEVNVKLKPTSPLSRRSVTPTTYHMSDICEYQLASSASELPSTMPSASCVTTDTLLDVERNTAAINGHRDHSPSPAAAAAAAAAAADVNVMSAESLALVPRSPVHPQTVSYPVCVSYSLPVAVSNTVVRKSLSLEPEELVKSQDSAVRTSCVRRRQSKSSVTDVTDCSMPSTCDILPSAALSHSVISADNCNILSSVSDIGGINSLAKPVITSKSDSHITTDTAQVQPSAMAVSVTNSTSLLCPALNSVTWPSSVHSTSTSSCNSHLSTTETPTSEQVEVCMTSDNHRDQVQMAAVDNASLQQCPLVPSCNVNSPARSLPHITVFPSISSAVTSSRNMASLNSVVRIQKPTSHMTAKLATSSSSPVYLVVGGNNNVISSSSGAVMKLVLMPGTKSMTHKAVSSMKPVTTAGVNRCITTSSILSQCEKVDRLSASSQPIFCTSALNKISRPTQISRTSSQVSLLRPQNVATSSQTTKPSSVELRAQTNRTSSNLNVFATKIGKQTVIVDIGSLSLSNLTAGKPRDTTAVCASPVKTKDLIICKSASTQQDISSVCGDAAIVDSSPAPSANNRPPAATHQVSINCAPVIRYVSCFVFFCSF